MKKKNKGFTLIEILVVVLIIGILASIALPQYRKAVLKAKLSEVLINVKALEDTMQRYILTRGLPSSGDVWFQDYADIELSGGEWNSGQRYNTEKFSYWSVCQKYGCAIEAYSRQYSYYVVVFIPSSGDAISRECYTGLNDVGRYVCKHLESSGYDYIDEDY